MDSVKWSACDSFGFPSVAAPRVMHFFLLPTRETETFKRSLS